MTDGIIAHLGDAQLWANAKGLVVKERAHMRTAPPAAPAATLDETALRELKTVLWPKAYREQDTALLDRLLHPSFQFIDDSGTRSTKAAEIEWVRRNRTQHSRFRFEIERLDIYADSAVIDGFGVIENDDCSKDAEARYYSSNFFIKENGSWRAVASHTSGSRVVRPATCAKPAT